MSIKCKPLDIHLLQSLLAYDPVTGHLKWKPFDKNDPVFEGRKFNCNRGLRAGKLKTGKPGYKYRAVKIDGREILEHRVCWAVMTGQQPPQKIDHLDGDASNNKWSNLRAADASINQKNNYLMKNNTSGVCGVSWQKTNKKWRAKIRSNGKDIILGLFDNLEDAASARKEAEKLYGFTERHGERRPEHLSTTGLKRPQPPQEGE